MTAVWTAMSLQRRDGSSNSLSRSLGSLISPRYGEEYSTVLLHSNMSPQLVQTSEQPSHWSVDEHLVHSLGSTGSSGRKFSVPEPKFQKVMTDSASSIMYLGKRIVREYQCTFVLPDAQQVSVTRMETFMPEDGSSAFTVSLAVAAPPEQPEDIRGARHIRKRIEDFLSASDWKSAMLASSESKDAELLGRLNSKYSNAVSRRSRFERSESQKRRHEMVRAREAFSDEEDGVRFSSDEEPAAKSSPLMRDSGVSSHALSPPRTISPEPRVIERHPISPGLIRRSTSNTPPIIAHAEPPGRRQAPISDAKSRQKFEELRRTWDERVAREQSIIDEQPISPDLSARSRGSLFGEGHRGSAITSILPTVPGRKRTPEPPGSRFPRTSSSGPSQGDRAFYPVKRFSSSEGAPLHETYKSPSLPESAELLSPPYVYSDRHFVTSPVFSEPSTERVEKETRFGYNQTSVRMHQENIGRLEPKSPDLGRVHPPPNRQAKSYSDTDYAEFPSVDDRSPWFPERLAEDTSRHIHPSVPEFPSAYKSPQISDRDLWQQRQMQRYPGVERKESFAKRRSYSTPSYAGVEQSRGPIEGRTEARNGLPAEHVTRHRKQDEHEEISRSFFSSETQSGLHKWFSYGRDERGESPSPTTQAAYNGSREPDVSFRRAEKSTPDVIVKHSDRKTLDELHRTKPRIHHKPSSAYPQERSSGPRHEVLGADTSTYEDSFLAPTPYRAHGSGKVSLHRDPLKTADLDRIRPKGSTKSFDPLRPVKRSSSDKVSSMAESDRLKRARIRRRKSDLDKRIDEHFDKAYEEELVRKASLSSGRRRGPDHGSTSDLSELASQEEKRRALAVRQAQSYKPELVAGEVQKLDKHQVRDTGPTSPSEYHPQSMTGRKRWPPPPARPEKQDKGPEIKLRSLEHAQRFKPVTHQVPIGEEIPIDQKAVTQNDIATVQDNHGRGRRFKQPDEHTHMDEKIRRNVSPVGEHFSRKTTERGKQTEKSLRTAEWAEKTAAFPDHKCEEAKEDVLSFPSTESAGHEFERTRAYEKNKGEGWHSPLEKRRAHGKTVEQKYKVVGDDERGQLTTGFDVKPDEQVKDHRGSIYPTVEEAKASVKSPPSRPSSSHELITVDLPGTAASRNEEAHRRWLKEGEPNRLSSESARDKDEIISASEKKPSRDRHWSTDLRRAHGEPLGVHVGEAVDERRRPAMGYDEHQSDHRGHSYPDPKDVDEQVRTTSAQPASSREVKTGVIDEHHRKRSKKLEDSFGHSFTQSERDKFERLHRLEEKPKRNRHALTYTHETHGEPPEKKYGGTDYEQLHLTTGLKKPHSEDQRQPGTEGKKERSKSPSNLHARPASLQTADRDRATGAREEVERRRRRQGEDDWGTPSNDSAQEKSKRKYSPEKQPSRDRSSPTDIHRTHGEPFGRKCGATGPAGRHILPVPDLYQEEDKGYAYPSTEKVRRCDKSHTSWPTSPQEPHKIDQFYTTSIHEEGDRRRQRKKEEWLGHPSTEPEIDKFARINRAEKKPKTDRRATRDVHELHDESFGTKYGETGDDKQQMLATGSEKLHGDTDKFHRYKEHPGSDGIRERSKSPSELYGPRDRHRSSDRAKVSGARGDMEQGGRRQMGDEESFPSTGSARDKYGRIRSPGQKSVEYQRAKTDSSGKTDSNVQYEAKSTRSPELVHHRSLLSPRFSPISPSRRTEVLKPLSLPMDFLVSLDSSPVSLHSGQIEADVHPFSPTEDRLISMDEQQDSGIRDHISGQPVDADKEKDKLIVVAARSTVDPPFSVKEKQRAGEKGLHTKKKRQGSPDSLIQQNQPFTSQPFLEEATGVSKKPEKLVEQGRHKLCLTGSELFRRRLGVEPESKYPSQTEARPRPKSYDPLVSGTVEKPELFTTTSQSISDPSQRKGQKSYDAKLLESNTTRHKRRSKQVPTESDRDARRKPWYSDRQEDSMKPVGGWESERRPEEHGDREWSMGRPSDAKGLRENGYVDQGLPPPDFEERKVSQFPTRKRHPPPPTSPTFQPPSSSARISDTTGRGQRPTDRHTTASPIQNGHYQPEASRSREVIESRPGDDQQSEKERRKQGTRTPGREERPSQRDPVDSTGGKKRGAKLPVSPEDREGGFVSPTDRTGNERGRKQREKDERRSGKESKRGTKPRHPPPPEASSRRREPAVNGYGGKVKPSTQRRTEPMFEDADAEYVNFPGSIAPGAQPRDEELKRVTQETSDQSNEQSSYDPRVTEGMHGRHPAPVVMRRKEKPGEPSGSRAPVSPRKQKLPSSGKPRTERPPPVQGYRTPRDDFEDEDDEDLESSDEDLKPPALISIPQTKKSSDSLVRGSQPTNGVQLRHPSRTSPRGTLVSPRGTTALSLGARISGGTWDRSSQGRPHGRYRPEQFHPHDYERASRPRSKRDTATSDRYGVSGSKHSMIISTKRRTLSGVTGVPPNRVRSSSMNTLWFGDHPVPRSADAVSLTAPLRLSTIQLQAQAELERRHRSSSRTHSLDRRSTYSVGGTESRLSRGAGEIEGYEGIGYGYDTRGRLIHGGANLHERAASRRRRLRDGHESLSRVWIPQSDGGSPTRHTNEPLPSDASRLDHRKSNLDESAVAFALRDFTSPGVGGEDHEDSIVYDDEDEHIYARPDSIQSETSPKPPEQKQRPHSGQTRSAKSHRTSNLMQVHLRRPKLLSTRCSSMPLPDAKQYESLLRLSTFSFESSSHRSGKSPDRPKYLLESNV